MERRSIKNAWEKETGNQAQAADMRRISRGNAAIVIFGTGGEKGVGRRSAGTCSRRIRQKLERGVDITEAMTRERKTAGDARMAGIPRASATA